MSEAIDEMYEQCTLMEKEADAVIATHDDKCFRGHSSDRLYLSYRFYPHPFSNVSDDYAACCMHRSCIRSPNLFLPFHLVGASSRFTQGYSSILSLQLYA